MKVLLKLRNFFLDLAQIKLMKHESCFESRNHAAFIFIVPLFFTVLYLRVTKNMKDKYTLFKSSNSSSVVYLGSIFS